MRTIIKLVVLLGLLAACFCAGVKYQYRAQRAEIADIEQVALEACNMRIKTLTKLNKRK